MAHRHVTVKKANWLVCQPLYESVMGEAFVVSAEDDDHVYTGTWLATPEKETLLLSQCPVGAVTFSDEKPEGWE